MNFLVVIVALARQQGLKAAKQPGNKAETQQGNKAANVKVSIYDHGVNPPFPLPAAVAHERPSSNFHACLW